ncbi:MAG: DUF624 domain-containing protein [Oscillospiraceae bacterium]|nr:DUF624 domain-containing protein [Oscillospiraceae bacterium]
MGIFGQNYMKAGPGIAKNAPKKKPFFRFWEIYFRKFWKLAALNFLTLIACLPIVTIGPAIAGMTKVLRNYVLEKNSFILHDFRKGFTENWKKSLPAGLIDVTVFISALCSVQVYTSFAENAESGGLVWYILCAVSLSAAFTVFMMNFYFFPMIVATDLDFRNCIKNSFLLVCLGLKKNIITLLLVAFTVAFTLLSLYIAPYLVFAVIPFWIISFLGFLIMFNSYPAIQKYVIEPFYKEQGRDNPEYDYLKPLVEDDSIFTDKGGEEKTVEPEKEKKGKVIS